MEMGVSYEGGTPVGTVDRLPGDERANIEVSKDFPRPESGLDGLV